jgi:hypothetical protein
VAHRDVRQGDRGAGIVRRHPDVVVALEQPARQLHRRPVAHLQPPAANPVMVTGLVRLIEAAKQIMENGKRRTLAHATSGPCLQQNLVCILEGDE